MTWMVTRVTGWWSQPYPTSSRMGMGPQCIHMAGFAADLQLVFDKRIMRSWWIWRRMMWSTLERTPTKWSGWGCGVAWRWAAATWTAATLASACAVWSS